LRGEEVTPTSNIDRRLETEKSFFMAKKAAKIERHFQKLKIRI
jgi:hypothetical protein